MMRAILHRFLAVLMVLTSVSAAASQQGRSLESYLALLDQKLSFAQQLISINKNGQYITMLAEARQLRTKATEAIARGESLAALNHLRAAHRLVDQVTHSSIRNPLERMRNQLNELLQRSEQIVLGSGNREAERLLNEAKDQKAKAAAAVLQKRFQMALEHFRVAVYLAQRAIELVEGPKKNLSERVADARRQYQELLSTARDMVARSDNPIAKRVLDQAVQQALGTRAALNRGNFAVALDLYHRSTRLLLRAINIAEGQSTSVEEQAREELTHINELIEYSEQQLQGKEDATTHIFLTKARDLQQLAQSNYNAGRYQRTIQNAEAAEGVLRRLMRRVSTPPGDVAMRVQQELDRLQNALAAAADATLTENKRELQLLHEEARNLAQSAEAALSRSENRYALELILAGNRLLTAGQGLKQSAAALMPGAAELQAQLQQLDSSLEETNKRVGEESGDAFLLLDQSKMLRTAAQEALYQENHALAYTLIQIATDFCQKASSIKMY